MLSRFLFCVGAVTGVVGVKLYDAHTPLQLERPSYSDRDYVIKSSTYSMAMQDRIARTYHQSMLAGFFGGSCLGAVPYMCGIGYKSKSARNG